MRVKHKFNARPSLYDGIKFPSKKEGEYYKRLKLLQASGEVLFFLRQVPFHLAGGVKYVCDFQVFRANGEVTFEDVKGMRTPLYVAKKKLTESTYPITITEV